MSAVGIATGCGLDGRRIGVRVIVGEKFFPSVCLDRFWGRTQPPTLEYSGRSVKLTTHLQLVQRNYTSTPPLIHPAHVVFNYLSIETISPFSLGCFTPSSLSYLSHANIILVDCGVLE
jgi:hypothetical protein